MKALLLLESRRRDSGVDSGVIQHTVSPAREHPPGLCDVLRATDMRQAVSEGGAASAGRRELGRAKKKTPHSRGP